MGAQKDTNQPFLKAFDEALARGAERLCQPWLHSDLIYNNLPVYARLLKSKHLLWDFVKEVIQLFNDVSNTTVESLPLNQSQHMVGY